MFFSVLSIIFIKVRINVKWEQHKLGEISFKVNTKNKENLTLPVLSNSAEYGIVNQEDYFDKKIANHTDNYYIVKHNDFVYNPRISNKAPYGPIRRNTLDAKGLMSPLYYVFRINDGNYVYLDYYFKSGKWYKFMYQNGDSGARSDRFAIKDKIFQMMPISMPNTKEQNKIGQLMKTLQKLNDLQQRKLEQLKQLKKAMLQQLFVDKNNKQPNLRFKNFKGDWEQHRLEEVAQVTMGQSPSSKNYTDNPNDYVLVQGNADLKSNEISPRVWTKEVTKQVHKGEFIMTVRAPVGYLAMANMDAVIGRGVAAIDGNKYLYYLLQTKLLDRTWEKLSSGSTFESISSNDIKNLEIKVTENEEEKLIAKLMDTVTCLLPFWQSKIDQLTILKRYLLQKLFI
ncbi:restriction endonuclease subunit S [Limosilactobacillus reuteri]|uniref:restriction endonuclease subunit S n=1 Tax=Limosilactobacillus reuteri TaxID=1598 RepID=UPI00292A57F8|nr:restriction endonuclease subunit S [Limosilactobacillus reuteri]